MSGWSSDVCSSDRTKVSTCALMSVALEHGFLLGGEGDVCAFEILGLHADGLRLGFGFERGLQTHGQFHVELVLGHGMREGMAVRSEERRVGKAGVSTCRSRGSADS